MLKRLRIYCKEMYPILPRLGLGYLIAGEIYFIVLLNHGVTWPTIWASICARHGIQELILGFTVFSFLFWLRIADDFKDYELDCRLFAHRPLPSGRVTKKDLRIFLCILIPVTLALNFIFMKNRWFCAILYTYGSLMAIWFFQKYKIQKSLPLALVTHNPVQFIMNVYIISFAVIQYKIRAVDLINVFACFTLYFPALYWEVSRKIRAPQDETEYVTYSKLFGYKKATNFAMFVVLIDICTNFVLVWNLSKLSVAALAILVGWMCWTFQRFKQDPTRFKLVTKVETYTYIQELTMIATVVIFLLVGKIG